MAKRAYRMTPARRAALKKAQAASARKRRGKGKGKLAAANRSLDSRVSGMSRKRRVAYLGAAYGAIGLAAAGVYANKKYQFQKPKAGFSGSHVKTHVKHHNIGGGVNLITGAVGIRGRGIAGGLVYRKRQ